MSSEKYESQFSIYKFDYERAEKYYNTEKKKKIDKNGDIEKFIYDDIKEDINAIYKNPNIPKIYDIDNLGFKGIVFEITNTPNWNLMIKLLVNSLDSLSIKNTHASYILSYKIDDTIYFLTGGLGSNYLNNIIEKNFGLYLLPKIISDTDASVKTVLENKLMGNMISQKKANKNSTTIRFENELTSIFRELSLEFDKNVVESLGILVNNKRKINVVARDSLVIRKSMSLEQLSNVLNKLIELEKKEDRFTLGYFIPAKKKDYKISDLNDLLKNSLIEKKYDNFIIVGGEYYSYYTENDEYVIEDENAEFLKSHEPIEMSDIFNMYFQDGINASRVDKFLNLKLSTFQDGNPKLQSLRLKSCLQGHVESKDGKIFYLFNDNWLVFDNKYLEKLSEDFKEIYNDAILLPTHVKQQIRYIEGNSEDKYNDQFEKSDFVIEGHKVKVDNVELADLIYYDEKNVYLFHNKQKFDGAGARDVMNQVITSAEVISNYLASDNSNVFFESYISKLKSKRSESNAIKKMDASQFISILRNRRICYVVGIIEGFNVETRSNYAKYMTINAFKILKNRNYKLYFLDIGNNK